MKKNANMIAIAISSLALLFLSGCTQAEWDQFWAEQRQAWGTTAADREVEPERQVIIIDSDDSYWRTQYEIEKLKRLERQQALEAARIREHTRRMLQKMELERKLREQR